MLLTSLGHELFPVNQTYNLLGIIVYDIMSWAFETCFKTLQQYYNYCSDRQFDIVEIVYDFTMTRAARDIKIACENCKQKYIVLYKLALRDFSGEKFSKSRSVGTCM